MRTRKAARRPLRSLASLAVLAVTLASPRAVRAEDLRTEHELEQAEQALVNLDYDGASAQATRVWQMRGLTHDQLVRAARVAATTAAVLDKGSAARDAFQLLLTYDPTYASDANLGPKVQAPFLEARGFMRAQPSQPGVEAFVTLRPNEPATLRVMTHDPTHVGTRIVVAFRWGGEGGFQQTSLPMGSTLIDVPPPPPTTTRLDYYVQVLDDHDSAAFESGNAAVPKSATIALPPPSGGITAPPPGSGHGSLFSSPVFWAIVGVAVAGAGTGIYFGARKTTTTETVAPSSATLLPGFKCNGGSC